VANTIQIKRSSTASDTPSASDLAVGELAVNTADAKLFTKHTDGTVKELAGGGGGGGGSVALDDITTGDAASTLATTAGNITIDAQGNNTDIIFKGDDGSGGTALYFKADGSTGASELYNYGNLKLATTSSGATVTGTAKATVKFETDDVSVGFTSNGATSGSGNFGVASSTGGARINADSGSDAATFVDFDATNISASGGDVTYRFGRGTTEGSSDLSQLIMYAHDGTNNPVITLDSAGKIHGDSLDIARDTDASAEIGRAHIGNVNQGDHAGFSHVDQNFSGNYALLQSSTGNTFLNAASGQTVHYRINNSDVMTMDNTGLGITGDLTLTSTDAGATENPTLDLYRNSTSPDVDDVLGNIDFSGMNDASTPEKVVYAKINADIADETDDTEDGRLDIRVISNGILSNRITIQGNGHTLFQGRDVRLQGTVDLVFEGSVTNGTRTTLTVVNPTQANTITLPNASGTVSLNTPDTKVLLATTTVSSSVSSVDFDSSLITDTYTTYWVKVNNMTVSSSNTALNMRLGTSNAVDTGNNYVWRQGFLGIFVGDSFDQRINSDATDSRWLMSDDSTEQALGNNATMQWSASWKLYNLRSTTTGKGCVIWDESFGKTRSNFYNTYTLQRNIWHYGVEDTAVNFIRLYLSNGTIESGVFRLYGSNE
jgi:hypothetical protein